MSIPAPVVVLRSVAVLALLLLGAGAAPADRAQRAAERRAEERLPALYRSWLQEVAPLITEAERTAFLAIEQDYQRDAFIERFWRERDPYPDTARNELRDTWDARVAEARQAFGDDLDEDRARMFLLNGAPTVRQVDTCGILLWPTEVWIYPPSERVRQTIIAVFYRRGAQGKFRIWMPADGLAVLFQGPPPNSTDQRLLEEIALACVRADQFAPAIANVFRRGQFDYTKLVADALAPVEAPSREWVSTFNSYSTAVPEQAAPLPAELALGFPGRRQSRTVVQGAVAVPAAAAGQAEIGGARSYNFLLNGEVLAGGKLFDSFRYKYDLPASQVASASIPLVFERFLRPGTYRLIVKVEDLNGGRFFRDQRELEVPALDAENPPRLDAETERLLAEANASLSTLDNTIQIIEPRGSMQAGLIRFDTLTSGAAITEVEFALDDKPILRKNRPPYSVELDLGEVPRTRRLVATAFDAEGREIASDEALLNSSPHRFAVRLIEPHRGRHYSGSLRAEAQVELPEDATLERMEFFLNETLVATLYQEPFTHAIVLPADQPVAYVRAVAYQADGNSTEDLVFVNAPDNLEEVDVQFVELYTTVVDRDQRPVSTLPKEAFRVAEDGVEQQLVRFELLENLPIHIVVLLDTSASMEPSLGQARDAALNFFRAAIAPRDRAALVPFNDRPMLAVKLTGDVEALAGGLAGLKAERGTSLYDAVVFSLFYFNGIKGQRALLVLSDGEDQNSRFRFDETLDFARRAGVAIYTIGLDIGRSGEARKVLRRLADETGGRSFFVDAATELGPVYEAVQSELRARYLLAYQSTNPSREQKFRTVEVAVDRAGLEAKTMRGYYP